MDPGEQTTGTRDEHYNLISVLYHALHGAETCDIYALDAEAEGRTDLYEFFREAQVAQTHLAERAKELLGIGAGVAPGAGGVAPGVAPPETDVPPEPPPESDVPVESPAGDVPPRSVDIQSERGAPPDLTPEEDVVGPEVPPDAPRTGDVPPRTGEEPPSPSEPPDEEPLPGEERPPRPSP